jgi:hypothetical protein
MNYGQIPNDATYIPSTTPLLLITQFHLPFNGLHLTGIDSHVFRPIITAFIRCGEVVEDVAEWEDEEEEWESVVTDGGYRELC